jgi:outer membrane protein
MHRLHLICVTVAILLIGSPGFAEQGDTEVGFRLLWVTGSASSAGTIAETGSAVTLSSGPGIEIDWVLWPLDELTVELAIGGSAQPVGTSGGELGGVDGGTLWRIPLSAVAQYRPDLYGSFDPYVGLGLVYNATAYDESSEYESLFSDVSFSNDLNVVVQAGVTYTLDVRWSANLDLRYMAMGTDATFTGFDGSTQTLGMRFDPWVVGLGFRFRY